MKIWLFLYIQWRPHLIWSSNHKEIWIFVKQVTGPFVPSFAIRMYMAFTDTLRSQHTDLQTFQILCIPFPTKVDPDNLKGCQICNDHINYNLHNIKVCHLSQRGIIDHNYLLYHNNLRSQIHVFVYINTSINYFWSKYPQNKCYWYAISLIRRLKGRMTKISWS